MNKTIKAVAPFAHPGFLNFKQAPFAAWVRNGGLVAQEHYPPRWLHGAAYRWELSTIWKSRKEARLRFVFVRLVPRLCEVRGCADVLGLLALLF